MKTILCVLFILSAIITIIIYPSFIMAGRADKAIEQIEIKNLNTYEGE